MAIQNLRIFKKLLLISAFAMLSIVTFSQTNENLDFTYKVDSTLVDNEYKFNIQIVVKNGDGPFIFELCDNALANGGKSLEKSISLINNTYTFANLSKEDYYVYVYLTDGKFGRGKKIKFN